jgi:hypothetical protein
MLLEFQVFCKDNLAKRLGLCGYQNLPQLFDTPREQRPSGVIS